MATIAKKRKVVLDGLFYAELNAFLEAELGSCGYSGCEVRRTPVRTEIIIKATKSQEVLGEKGRRIRELTQLVQRRFHLPENGVSMFVERFVISSIVFVHLIQHVVSPTVLCQLSHRPSPCVSSSSLVWLFVVPAMV